MASYASLTTESPSRIKRWSHFARFEQALTLSSLQPGDVIADYGAGDGFLLERAFDRVPLSELWAFEPQLSLEARNRLHDKAQIVESASLLPHLYFDKVFCMEVIEHLPKTARDEAFANIRQILKPTGSAIFTVPIEIGLTSLIKNIIRIFTGSPHNGTSVVSIFWSILGKPEKINRYIDGNEYISSHLGYDYRTIEKDFQRHGFEIKGTSFSPIAIMGSFINSQISYCVKKVDLPTGPVAH